MSGCVLVRSFQIFWNAQITSLDPYLASMTSNMTNKAIWHLNREYSFFEIFFGESAFLLFIFRILDSFEHASSLEAFFLKQKSEKRYEKSKNPQNALNST
jgi:hypothetical protein